MPDQSPMEPLATQEWVHEAFKGSGIPRGTRPDEDVAKRQADVKELREQARGNPEMEQFRRENPGSDIWDWRTRDRSDRKEMRNAGRR